MSYLALTSHNLPCIILYYITFSFVTLTHLSLFLAYSLAYLITCSLLYIHSFILMVLQFFLLYLPCFMLLDFLFSSQECGMDVERTRNQLLSSGSVCWGFIRRNSTSGNMSFPFARRSHWLSLRSCGMGVASPLRTHSTSTTTSALRCHARVRSASYISLSPLTKNAIIIIIMNNIRVIIGRNCTEIS